MPIFRNLFCLFMFENDYSMTGAADGGAGEAGGGGDAGMGGALRHLVLGHI